MEEKELEELRALIQEQDKRIQQLEREFRLKEDPDYTERSGDLLEVKGDFFQMIKVLKTLYLGEEDDMAEIEKISRDIEDGHIKVDMTDLFFRFFVRQEIQNARIKLLFLSQRYQMDPSLFDQLDDLSTIIDDQRYSVQQVIVGWKRFEREASTEIRRLSK
ncbi:MAG: hypothetical protein U9R75_07285 [Candidatus Thermoplasmatota archaeon]|nr:hypothetical protein [Candidatus Thermoplasmatota archaeon]